MNVFMSGTVTSRKNTVCITVYNVVNTALTNLVRIARKRFLKLLLKKKKKNVNMYGNVYRIDVTTREIPRVNIRHTNANYVKNFNDGTDRLCQKENRIYFIVFVLACTYMK